MSKYIYKRGLYEKTDYIDLPVPKYKSYVYTEKDKIDTEYFFKIPLFYLDLKGHTLSYDKGVLEVDGVKEDVSNLLIGDLLNKIKGKGIEAELLENSTFVLKLPTIILSDFITTYVHKIDGDISPYNIKHLPKNKMIYTEDYKILDIKVIDIENNILKKHEKIGDDLFYTVGKQTKIFITIKSDCFYVLGNFGANIIKNGHVVANLADKIKGT